jgi:phosphate:Na+ symporter
MKMANTILKFFTIRSPAEQYLERLRAGRPETLETTSLHLEVLRELTPIHSHVCSVAYTVLDAASAEQTSITGNQMPILQQRKPSTQSQ